MFLFDLMFQAGVRSLDMKVAIYDWGRDRSVFPVSSARWQLSCWSSRHMLLHESIRSLRSLVQSDSCSPCGGVDRHRSCNVLRSVSFVRYVQTVGIGSIELGRQSIPPQGGS